MMSRRQITVAMYNKSIKYVQRIAIINFVHSLLLFGPEVTVQQTWTERMGKNMILILMKVFLTGVKIKK
jgi:hypothetical protein